MPRRRRCTVHARRLVDDGDILGGDVRGRLRAAGSSDTTGCRTLSMSPSSIAIPTSAEVMLFVTDATSCRPSGDYG